MDNFGKPQALVSLSVSAVISPIVEMPVYYSSSWRSKCTLDRGIGGSLCFPGEGVAGLLDHGCSSLNMLEWMPDGNKEGVRVEYSEENLGRKKG